LADSQEKYLQKFGLRGIIIIICLLALSNPSIHALEHVKVGVYENPPLVFTNNHGNVEGIYIDILNNIASKEHWKLEYVECSWDNCLNMLKNNSIDILPAIAYSKERSKIYDFNNETVISNYAVIYVNKGSDIKSFIDLHNKRIGVVRGDIHYTGEGGIKDILKKFDINSTFVEYNTYSGVLKALEENKIDAGVINRLYDTRHGLGYSNIEETSIIFNPIELRFAFTKNITKSKALIEGIDYNLAEMKKNKGSVYYKTIEKYIGGESGFKTLPQWVKKLFLAAAALLILFVVTHLMLRRELRARTKEISGKNSELIKEIGERKIAEEKLRRANKALRTLSDCNQVLIRANDMSKFLNDICRIIVEVGSYHLAWVGFAEHDKEKTVRPVAKYGNKDDYVEVVKISWDDSVLGRGPTGTAIRTGKTCFSKNILTNQDYKPWREEAYKREYVCSIAIPLKVEEKVIGALNVYSSEEDAFNWEDMKFLEELANDIAFGIVTLRNRIERQKAEEDLRKSEEKYRMVVENVNEIIYVIEDDLLKGKLRFISSKVEDITGYLPEEFLENPGLWIDIVYPDDLVDIQSATEEILKTGKPGTRIYRICHRKTGNRVWIEDKIAPQHDEKGRITAFFGAARDITDRKNAAEMLRRTAEKLSVIHEIDRDIIDKLNIDSILKFIVNKARELTEADVAFYGIVEGDTMRLYVASGTTKDITENFKFRKGTGIGWFAIENKKPVVVEDIYNEKRIKNIRYDRLELENLVSLIAVPFFSGKNEPLGVLFVANRRKTKFTEEQIDTITSLTFQATMAIEHPKLYSELKKAHEKLRVAYDELKSISELKRNIISNVSHELYTPLTIIKGSLDILRDEEKDENKIKLLQLAHNAISRQKLIIRNLIEAAELERGKIKLELRPVKIEELILSLADEFQPQLLDKGISMSINIKEDIPPVLADRIRIKHILRNLINNAIKFNKKEGKILIEVEKKENIEVCVEDTGIGIPEDKVNKIFQQLYQIDSSTSRRYGGTGMGLMVVKETVKAHGGSISIKSKEGKGTRICFTLLSAKKEVE